MKASKMCVDMHAKIRALSCDRAYATAAFADSSKTDSEPIVTPWEVQGIVDYDKLIDKFGCSKIDTALIDKIKEATKIDPHVLIRRGLVFSHRDLDKILDNFEKGFYLYTGRGPSSSAMHLGHLVPFSFTQYLQYAFDVPLVIQITDDEKYLFKSGIDHAHMDRIAVENIKDIIAIGFDPKKTFIFRNYEYLGRMYRVVSKIQKSITASQARNCFGFKMEDNIGMWSFPAIQAAPCFAEAFPVVFPAGKMPSTRKSENEGEESANSKPSIFQRILRFFFPQTPKEEKTAPLIAENVQKNDKAENSENSAKREKSTKTDKSAKNGSKPHNIPCLIPCAIDQDPYFRLTRDIAPRLGYLKPSLIHSVFLPSLTGPETKMSGSAEGSCIYLTDTDAQIKKKVNRFAFSGGGQTLLEHLELGGNSEIDVPLQWLRFFMPWDFDVDTIPGCTADKWDDGADAWEKLRWAYETGRITSATVKAVLIGVLQAVVERHRKERANVTDAMVREFMRERSIL